MTGPATGPATGPLAVLNVVTNVLYDALRAVDLSSADLSSADLGADRDRHRWVLARAATAELARRGWLPPLNHLTVVLGDDPPEDRS